MNGKGRRGFCRTMGKERGGSGKWGIGKSPGSEISTKQSRQGKTRYLNHEHAHIQKLSKKMILTTSQEIGALEQSQKDL